MAIDIEAVRKEFAEVQEQMRRSDAKGVPRSETRELDRRYRELSQTLLEHKYRSERG